MRKFERLRTKFKVQNSDEACPKGHWHTYEQIKNKNSEHRIERIESRVAPRGMTLQKYKKEVGYTQHIW